MNRLFAAGMAILLSVAGEAHAQDASAPPLPAPTKEQAAPPPIDQPQAQDAAGSVTRSTDAPLLGEDMPPSVAPLSATGYAAIAADMYRFDANKNIVICGVRIEDAMPGNPGGCVRRKDKSLFPLAMPGEFISPGAYVEKFVAPSAVYLGFGLGPGGSLILFYRNIPPQGG